MSMFGGGVMLSNMWDFLKDGSNQTVLNWIAGGIAAVGAGMWAVVKLVARNGDHKLTKPSVSADRGSTAAGRDIIGGSMNINARDTSKRSSKR
jgi:hypothetical protein